MLGQMGFIFLPVSFQEDELTELTTPPDYWNPLDGFFENDEDMAMLAGRVSNPPKIEPIGIYLRIVRLPFGSLYEART